MRSLTTVILGMRAWKVGPILVPASRSNRAKRAKPGKWREVLDRTFKYGIIPRLGACFASRIGTVTMGKCGSGAKKGPYASARFGAPKVGTDKRTFFSPCSRGDPFVKVLDCGLCRQLALLSGQKSILVPKIDKNRPRNSPTLPDTAGRPRIVENRWKTLKNVEKRWKTLQIVENRWRSLKIVENRCLLLGF